MRCTRTPGPTAPRPAGSRSWASWPGWWRADVMRPIKASLWFDGTAEDAATFYANLFDDAEVTGAQRYTEAGPGVPGSVVSVTWRIGDREFVGISGGPMYTLTPAISFVVECED